MLLSGLSSNSSPIPPSSVLLNNEKSIIHVSRSIRTSQEPEDVSSYGLSFNVIKLALTESDNSRRNSLKVIVTDYLR
ncbi:hypothetical protein DTO271D3_4359 [Paecilomyces variotii]|nr:hypothetical protein DTO271D3_4359 [Paecilomyces variotii]